MRMTWYDDFFKESWKRFATVRHSAESTATSTTRQLPSCGAQSRGKGTESELVRPVMSKGLATVAVEAVVPASTRRHGPRHRPTQYTHRFLKSDSATQHLDSIGYA